MGLGTYLKSLTKPELEELKETCNFTEEDVLIFDMLSKNKSTIEISERLNMSKRTVDRRISNLKGKVERMNGGYYTER